MKERPILFNEDMVRAILSGQKTQTRRAVKYIPQLGNPDQWCAKVTTPGIAHLMGDYTRFCQFGCVGDRLWVRETWMPLTKGAAYRVDGLVNNNHPLTKWKPSIHMPRWASRINLEITSTTVERLLDISESDAKSEGFKDRAEFLRTWESIYGDVHKVPWVWVVSFKRIEG